MSMRNVIGFAVVICMMGFVWYEYGWHMLVLMSATMSCSYIASSLDLSERLSSIR